MSAFKRKGAADTAKKKRGPVSKKRAAADSYKPSYTGPLKSVKLTFTTTIHDDLTSHTTIRRVRPGSKKPGPGLTLRGGGADSSFEDVV